MIESLYQLAAVAYLASALAGGYGIGLSHLKARRFGVAVMGAGWLMHGLGLAFMHQMPDRPPLSEWSPTMSLTVWLTVLFFLLLRLRMRISGMVVFVAPPAFIGMVFATVWLPGGSGIHPTSGLWSHAHIMLAASGVALLTVAAAAGGLFIFANRLLKDRRPAARKIGLPSLEALDRVNLFALSLGFPLLTLGLITGVLFSMSEHEKVLANLPHAIGTALAWALYVVLIAARFGWMQEQGRQSPLGAAKSAIAGFVVLFIAVVGMRFLA
jgi:ABC-type uncharacterized transport system permease subunit